MYPNICPHCGEADGATAALTALRDKITQDRIVQGTPVTVPVEDEEDDDSDEYDTPLYEAEKDATSI